MSVPLGGSEAAFLEGGPPWPPGSRIRSAHRFSGIHPLSTVGRSATFAANAEVRPPDHCPPSPAVLKTAPRDWLRHRLIKGILIPCWPIVSLRRILPTAIVRHAVIRMETVTISPKFQIVIPQKIREAMGLRIGEKAHMLSFRNRIEVIPVRDIRALRGYLKGIDTSFVRDGDRV